MNNENNENNQIEVDNKDIVSQVLHITYKID